MDVWWGGFNSMIMNGYDVACWHFFFPASIVPGSDNIRHVVYLYGSIKCEKHIKIDLYAFG